MSRSRNTGKSWQNAYVTEQRQPSGHVGGGQFTRGNINPATAAAQRNQAAIARHEALVSGAQSHASGGGSAGGGKTGSDAEDRAEAEEARDLIAQANAIERQIDQLNAELKAARSNIASAQAGAAPGAASGAAQSATAAAAAAAKPGAAAGSSTQTTAQYVASLQSKVSSLKEQIKDLKAKRRQLLKRARALLRDAKKASRPSATKGNRVAHVAEATKAHTAGADGMKYFAFPIEKSQDTAEINPVDGTPDIEIWGKATDGTLDSDLQIVDPEWSLQALKTWFDTKANIRMGHDPKRPIGRGIEVQGHHIKALIADPVAKHLIRKGVLQDWSIGIMNPDVRTGDPKFSHLPDWNKATGGVITGRQDGLSMIGEVSAVDRGSNFGTKFAMCKAAADGSPEWVGQLSAPDDLLAKVGAPAITKAAKPVKSVNVDLPANMSLSIKPSDIAKLATFGRKLAMEEAANKAAAATFTKAAVAQSVSAAPDTPAAVEKRDFDPNVGGGVDRDKLPASDFAGRDRSFPIVKPGDVSDALLSIGRAGPGNYSPEKLRRNILRIARRKGFPIPEADRKGRKADKGADSQVTRDVAAAEQATSRAQAAQDTDPDRKSDPADRKVSRDLKRSRRALEATAREQAKDNAGDAKQHAKAKKAKAKKAAKAAGPQVVKKKKVTCQSCGAMQNRKHAMCSECGASLAAAPDVTKNHDFACLNCGHKPLDKGEKFCPSCGHENPGYTPLADRKLPMNAGKAGKPKTVKRAKRKKKKAKAGEPFGGKQAPEFGNGGDDKAATKAGKGRVVKKRKRNSGKPKGITPGEGVVGEHMEAAGPHREPDGSAMEAFERDAHMSDGDREPVSHLAELVGSNKSADPEVAAALHLRTLGVPRHLGALHALTCPAYKPKAVAKAFPHASFADIDPGEWQSAMLTKAASAPLAEVQAALAIGSHAEVLKGADPYLLADLRGEAHKMFRDANPGPSHFPTPGELSPERFRRPLITAGHEAASPGHKEPHRVQLPPKGGIAAEDYTRGYIGEGHAADAPGNGPRPEPMPAPAHTGIPTSGPARQFYTHAARDGARHAMEAMHDHIAATFPDLCPMHGAEDIARHPVPTPEGVPAVTPAPGKKGKKKNKGAKAKAVKGARPAKKAQRKGARPRKAQRAASRASGPALDADALKAAMAEASAPLLERINAQDAALKAAGKTLRKQRKALDAIAGQPDTRGAPMRGVALTKSSGSAVQAPSMAGLAEQAQLNKMALLAHEAANSPDPGRREAARAEWYAMAGVGSAMNHNLNYNAIPMNPRT